MQGAKAWVRRTPAAVVAAGVVCGISGPGPAAAGMADVVEAQAIREADGSYGFAVTVRHDDAGWDHYADAWDVVGPDGRVLATRVLLHPHETEQPFTRSLSGVRLPDGIRTVTIRARDKLHGYGGATVEVPLPGW